MSSPLRRHRLVPATVLVLVAALASACGGDAGTEAQGPASASTSPDPVEASSSAASSPDDHAEAQADLAAAGEAGTALLQAYEDYEKVLIDYIQTDIAEEGTAALAKQAAVDQGLEPYNDASTAYADAVDALTQGPLADDATVGDALTTYQADAQKIITARDTAIAYRFSYAVCNTDLQVSLSNAPLNKKLADACIEVVEPLATNESPDIAAYATAMTKLMRQRKKIYASIPGLADFQAPDPENLDDEELTAAGDEITAYTDGVKRAGRRLNAAYEVFLPSLEKLEGDDGSLRALLGGTSLEDTQAALAEALDSGAGNG